MKSSSSGDVMTAREAPAATQPSLAPLQAQLTLERAYSCPWNLRVKFSPVDTQLFKSDGVLGYARAAQLGRSAQAVLNS